MSIEAKLDALTAAVEANTAALSKIAGAAKAAGSAKTEAASTSSTASTGKAASSGKAGGKKALTVDDIRTTFGGYMSGTDDKDEKAERKKNVAAIIAHFGVERATDIAEENRAEAIGYIKTFEKGETPDFMNEDAAGEDDDESMI